MRDQNIRNKFKDGDVEVYQSVRALEKLINSVFNGKTKAAKESFDEVKEDLLEDFEPQSNEDFFSKICDHRAMAAVLHVYTMVPATSPRASAWALTAQAYLNKLHPLC